MRKAIDLIGSRFGYLVVIARAESTLPKHTKWLCLCDCGNRKEVYRENLIGKMTTSCGCWKRVALRTHGQAGKGKQTRAYRSWCHMKKRCSNPKHKDWNNYGGRGIKVCERWQKFENFFEDMGRPMAGSEIDRIDNDKDYEPENCRWADHTTQANNKRNTVYYTMNGETKSRQDWCRQYKINSATLVRRLSLGWSLIDALTKPINLSKSSTSRK